MKINEQWETLKEESQANIQEEGFLNRQIRSITGHRIRCIKNSAVRYWRNLNKYHRFLHDKIQKLEGKTERKTA